MSVSQQTTLKVSNKQPVAPCQGRSKCRHLFWAESELTAGVRQEVFGDLGVSWNLSRSRPRTGPICQPGPRRGSTPPRAGTQTCEGTQVRPKSPNGTRGLSLPAERSRAGRRHCSPRIPGGFVLPPHRSDGTLGLTGRLAGGVGWSIEHPCKWSAALSAVWGLEFTV